MFILKQHLRHRASGLPAHSPHRLSSKEVFSKLAGDAVNSRRPGRVHSEFWRNPRDRRGSNHSLLMPQALSRAVIFDVDGTLIDSIDFHARAWQEALALFGHQLSFKAVRAQIGKGGDQLLPVFLSPAEIRSYGEELTAARAELFRRKYREKLKPFPGVRALFKRVRDDGWKLAVASSAEKDELKFYLRLCGIQRLVDTATSAADANKSKPHPDIFNAAIRKLRTVASNVCLVIGDSPYDAIAARRAKIPAMGFLSGGFGRTKLRTAGCAQIYKGPADLVKRYDKSVFAGPETATQKPSKRRPRSQ